MVPRFVCGAHALNIPFGTSALLDSTQCDECTILRGYPEPLSNTDSIEKWIKHEDKRAIKLDNGKAPISLIPAEFIEGVAQGFAYGGKKYGVNNFRKGLNHSRCLDAAFRHLLAFTRGERFDPESGLAHLFHAGCSLAMLAYMQQHYPELNDIHEQVKDNK